MPALRSALACALALLVATMALPGAPAHFPVEDVRPGMEAIGRTVFAGDRLEEFRVHIIGVLRNVIGPKRDLILATLDGGPLANAGVIAGMSGSPVYIDGRLVGAVSYSLGSFSKEPIAGITPIGEMLEAAALTTPRRLLARLDSATPPVSAEAATALFRTAFAAHGAFAARASETEFLGPTHAVSDAIGTQLRPIATPLGLSGFDAGTTDTLFGPLRELGFAPTLAGTTTQTRNTPDGPLRPGDPVGVTLLSGDLEIGATGTVTHVEGSEVYAFGHPFYNLGPVALPMTRAWVHTVLPSLQASMKIASTGAVIGTVTQDRATTIAGRLGPGPTLIPITLTLRADRGIAKTMRLTVVPDQVFGPLMTYLGIVDTLGAYQRQLGAASFAVHGRIRLAGRGDILLDDLFTGDQALAAAAGYVMTPLNLLLRNADAPVTVEDITLEIDTTEVPRTATLERVRLDTGRVRPGATVPVHVVLRTYRGELVTRTVPIVIPANSRGSVSIMVSDGARLAQWEARELAPPPSLSSAVPQLVRAFNATRRNNRLYVRLVTADTGAVVRGESLASLPASVLNVLEADRSGGSFRPLQSGLSGDWELALDHVVTGTRTLTLPLDPD